MAYNHGREDRKWRIWKEAEEKLLRECGVDEATIEQIRIADRADFNSNRRFYRWTNDIAEYLEDIYNKKEDFYGGQLMRKEVSFKNRDRFIQLGIAISSLRKVRGMSQEKLAEKANISRSLLSVIEAPNAAHSFSLEVLYDIADALDVTPADLINASLFSDNIINNKHD